jgi:hypothetical protein
LPYSVRMNSMIDPQNEIETLAIVAPEEVYDGDLRDADDDGDVYDGPTCDDVAEPVYDGPADDSHMYPEDVEQDEYPW